MIDVSLNIWHVEACHRFLSRGTKALSSCRRLLLDSNVIEEEEEEEPEGHGGYDGCVYYKAGAHEIWSSTALRYWRGSARSVWPRPEPMFDK